MRSVAPRAGIVAAIAGLVAAFAPGGAVAAPACPAAVSPGDESALTAMINQTRRANGLAKVAGDKVLKVAGRQKSLAMAKGGAFAHASTAKLPWANGRAAGQNIAMASSTGVAFEAMLASPGHRQNLLAPSWRYTGVGVAARCDGMLFFTINLMAP
jgi:uncharacterized protein YkwD